jgi:hypothetical protein
VTPPLLGLPGAEPARQDAIMAEPNLVLRKQLEELRNLSDKYFDTFVNPRPRL